MSEKKPDDMRISSVPPFGLRMLPDLRAKVEKAAAENGRSMNAEIVARLEASFGGDSVRRLSLSALSRLSEDLRSVMISLQHEMEEQEGYHAISFEEHVKSHQEASEALERAHELIPVKQRVQKAKPDKKDDE